MRDQLPAAESANNVLEFEIMRLESEQPDITTDYLTENLLASTHPAVNWLRECINKTVADGLGTAVAGVFGGLPNTSFSQNVGPVSLTGVMSRSVVTLGAIFLVICGLVPKVGAVVSSMPISVLGGVVILMFGMVISAGINMLSAVNWNRRSLFVMAISVSIGLGLKMVPESLQHIGGSTLPMLMTSGLLPAAVLAVVLNLALPDE
jgi:xanthine/uracil permease